jgi:hypothetical protein
MPCKGRAKCHAKVVQNAVQKALQKAEPNQTKPSQAKPPFAHGSQQPAVTCILLAGASKKTKSGFFRAS